MTLRYCLSCKKIVDDIQSFFYKNQYYCSTCYKKLAYFGREEVSLSVDEVIAQYDAMHPFDPVGDFTGAYQNYAMHTFESAFSVSLLECQDILLHNPTDYDALLFMAKYYWESKQIQKTINCLEMLSPSQGLAVSDFYFFIHVLLSARHYSAILTQLKGYQEVTDPFFDAHHKAMAYLGLQSIQKAKYWFKKAYGLTDDTKRKKKISAVLKQLASF